MIFCNFLGINTHEFAKIIQILKIRTCFMQNNMKLTMKKNFDPKTSEIQSNH